MKRYQVVTAASVRELPEGLAPTVYGFGNRENADYLTNLKNNNASTAEWGSPGRVGGHAKWAVVDVEAMNPGLEVRGGHLLKLPDGKRHDCHAGEETCSRCGAEWWMDCDDVAHRQVPDAMIVRYSGTRPAAGSPMVAMADGTVRVAKSVHHETIIGAAVQTFTNGTCLIEPIGPGPILLSPAPRLPDIGPRDHLVRDLNGETDIVQLTGHDAGRRELIGRLVAMHDQLGPEVRIPELDFEHGVWVKVQNSPFARTDPPAERRVVKRYSPRHAEVGWDPGE